MSQPSRPELSGAAASVLVRGLAAAAIAVDGTPPFSDQALVEARSGDATVLGDEHGAAIVRPALLATTADTEPEPDSASASGAASVSAASASSAPGLEPSAPAATSGPFEAELVVEPSVRRAGIGALLLGTVIDATDGDLLVWAHGDHPGAARLASRFGLTATRRLLQQRARVDQDPDGPALPPGATVRAFRPGVDDEAWLDLNARAFASHPEQGSLAQSDLDARIAEPWFDEGDFLLLFRGDELLAFCWLKVEPSDDDAPRLGEFYAVGVSPDHQGEHLGGLVVDAGLVRLAERGVGTATLYVEGDNTAALRLYAARGFADYAVDVQYTLHR